MGIMITPRSFPGDVAPSVRMAGKPGANFNAEKNPYDRSVRGVRPAQKDLVAPAPKTSPPVLISSEVVLFRVSS